MTNSSENKGGNRQRQDRPGLRFRRLSISVVPFIFLYTLFTLVVFNGPFFARALGLLDDTTPTHQALTLGSLLFLQVFLLVLVLSLISFVSLRLMQAVSIVLLLVNSFAFYFIVIYGTLIDVIIIRNVFATDTKTTVDLMHPKLLLFVLGLGVIPSVFISRITLVRSRLWVRFGVLAATTAAFFSYAFATSYNWLWIDRNLPVLGSLSLPWSYVFNTVTYFRMAAALSREQELLPDGEFGAPLAPGERRIVVLVLGEAARARNHSLYGYARETNPYTRDLPIVPLPGAQACGTYTLAGLACMLTHEGSEASVTTYFEPLPSYLHRHGVDVIWRTNSSGEPRAEVDTYTTLADIQAACTPQDCPETTHEEVLLHGLAARIDASDSPRILVVVHQGNGSHGPAYYSQYPPAFERFKPVCDTVQIQNCSDEELVNAYDNTIVYTDFLLARLIEMLGGFENTSSAMVYASDHGQSLGEQGLYLHGLPNAIAPDDQRDIPILLWMSDSFAQAKNVDTISVTNAPSHGHDNVFHSVLGAFGLQSSVYKPEYDVFSRQKE